LDTPKVEGQCHAMFRRKLPVRNDQLSNIARINASIFGHEIGFRTHREISWYVIMPVQFVTIILVNNYNENAPCDLVDEKGAVVRDDFLPMQTHCSNEGLSRREELFAPFRVL
jgi:hypothetical protein